MQRIGYGDFMLVDSGFLSSERLELPALIRKGAQLTYWPPKAGPVLRRGERSRFVYLMLAGAGFVSYRATPSMEVMLTVIRPGDWVGLDQAMSQEPLPLEARLLVTSELLRVEREKWLDICSADSSLSLNLLSRTVSRQQEILQRLSACLTEPIEDRLPRMLWDLCEPLSHSPRGADGVRIPLTQDSLARMAGCTRVTLSRGLSSLSRLGLLHLKRGLVEVPAPDLLARYAGARSAPPPLVTPAIA
jgi:CRP/FNR family transcriptional regulator, cyclic AMP receptor protein